MWRDRMPSYGLGSGCPRRVGWVTLLGVGMLRCSPRDRGTVLSYGLVLGFYSKSEFRCSVGPSEGIPLRVWVMETSDGSGLVYFPKSRV
jgi:hypothetical protein